MCSCLRGRERWRRETAESEKKVASHNLRVREKERERRERRERGSKKECSCEREGGRLRGEDNVNKRRRTMRPGSGHVLETALSTFVLF